MTANPIIDPSAFLDEQLAQASPDLMRELLTTFVNALLSAQADSVCGAEYGARTAERTNRQRLACACGVRPNDVEGSPAASGLRWQQSNGRAEPRPERAGAGALSAPQVG